MSEKDAGCFVLQTLYCGECGLPMKLTDLPSPLGEIPKDLGIHPPFIKCDNERCALHGKVFHRPRFPLTPVEG